MISSRPMAAQTQLPSRPLPPMFLKNLHLVHFKNWEQGSFDFSEKLNCFVGPNGSGKTNVLDAIHYLSVCKSYLNSIDSQNIKDGEPFLVTEGDFEKNGETLHIYCGVKRGEKKIFKKNKKAYERLADHIGQFPTVVISPYDRDLITEGSDVRRRLMDNVVSQSDPVYLDDLVSYNKALQQRNALLKHFAAEGKFDRSQIEIYDHQLVERGQPIFEKRQDFLKNLAPRLYHFYKWISGGHEKPGIEYQSHLENSDFQHLLKENWQRDLQLQYSSIGIHKDDLHFTLDNRRVKKFGSQGQQKSFLIALKLAQYEFLKEKQKTKPILLLDDIFDKLDEARVQQLVNLVSAENFGQIFITDTHPERTENLVKTIDENAKVFNLEKETAPQ